MSRIICSLPNASEEINGVKFEAHEAGVISVDLSDEDAAQFLAIPGYQDEEAYLATQAVAKKPAKK